MGSNTSGVKTIEYSKDCYSSVRDFIHGDYVTLNEVFIPDYNICFNIMNEDSSKYLNVFECSEPRYENQVK